MDSTGLGGFLGRVLLGFEAWRGDVVWIVR